MARLIDVPWNIAAGGALAVSGFEGRRNRKNRLVNAYIARLLGAAAHDASLSKAFVRVAGLVDRPGKLLSPGLTLRVLRQTLRRSTSPSPQDIVYRLDSVAAGERELS